ncbi:Granzyme B [Sciurus carolinensis]|uniref:Granzyme B n=1 Tax=Sciurus carolinensis TaxID=30640 RepID=A0AA41MK75_SCICA|nr:Granzyme B [Sciurus carolinensis]
MPTCWIQWIHTSRLTFPSGEIIGGHEAKPHSRPYMAYLRILDKGSRKRCGGFLIREDFVLTAAHCQGSSINVTLGAHNIEEQEETQQVIPVKRAIQHPGYKSDHFYNDIMLLQLEKKAKLNPAVQTIKLPRSKDKVTSGKVCHVAGWGRMVPPKGRFSNTLQEVKMRVQKDQVCKLEKVLSKYYNSTIEMCVGDPKEKCSSFQLSSRIRQNAAVRPVALPQAGNGVSPGTLCTVTGWGLVSLNRLPNRLQEVQLRVQRDQVCSRRFAFYTGQTQICVGVPRERKNAFRGDSGGPLVCNNVAQGIVSYGANNGTPPAVFTRILSYLPWVQRTMRRFKWEDQTETPL